MKGDNDENGAPTYYFNYSKQDSIVGGTKLYWFFNKRLKLFSHLWHIDPTQFISIKKY